MNLGGKYLAGAALKLLIDKDVSKALCNSKSWVSARKEIFHYKPISSCSHHIGHVIPYNTCSYTSSPPILIYPLAVFHFPLIPLLSRGCLYWVSCGSQSFLKDFRWLSVFMHALVSCCLHLCLLLKPDRLSLKRLQPPCWQWCITILYYAILLPVYVYVLKSIVVPGSFLLWDKLN